MGKSKRLLRVVISLSLALLIVGLMIGGVALAIELPPPEATVAFIQTSGPNTPLNIGDWYTHVPTGTEPPGAGANRPHSFRIFVPCAVPTDQPITVSLFDPDLSGSAASLDEIRGTADDATFILLDPNGVELHRQVYTPGSVTPGDWTEFFTFTTAGRPCDRPYTLLAQTSNDDDNAWRLRVLPDNFEIQLAGYESSFQHTAYGCQDFYFFVPADYPLRLLNFDMDSPGMPATVTYFPPNNGASFSGTASGRTVWNGDGGEARHPGNGIPGGDTPNSEPGWWRAQLCVGDQNQYIFEAEGLPFFMAPPLVPQMVVTKTDGLAVVSPGQTVTYTIQYNNIGSGAAVNATLSDILPDLTEYVSCSGGSSCGYSDGDRTVTWNVGTVPSKATGEVTLTIRLLPSYPVPDSLVNTVNLDYEDSMGHPYPPATSTDTDVTVPAPDLTLAKSDGGATPTPGGTLVYTLSYANASATEATGVTIVETVPANTTFDAGSSQAGWQCADGSPAGTPCTFDVGTVAGNGNGQVTFAVRVVDPLPAGVTQVANSATIGDDGKHGTDPTPDNNTPTTGTPVQPAPDLTLTKDDGGVTAVAGGVVVYTLTYANVSPTEATGVTIVETVPLSTTFEAGSSQAGWQCANNGQAGATCTLDVGAVPGQSSPVQVAFAVRLADPVPAGLTLIDNSASIGDDGSHGADPTPENNVDTDDTPIQGVTPPPDPALAKTDNGVTTTAGGVVVYTLSYSNLSQTGATGVTITETVPANTTFNAAASQPTSWSCADNSLAGTLCTTKIAGIVGPGGQVTFAVRLFDPLPTGVTQVANSATIGDDGTHGADPNLNNNLASDSTPVQTGQPGPTGEKTKNRGNDNDDNDDDDGSVSPPPSAPSAPSGSAAPGAQPTPSLPVMFLPMTGAMGQPEAAAPEPSGRLWLWSTAVLVAAVSGLAWTFGKRRGRK